MDSLQYLIAGLNFALVVFFGLSTIIKLTNAFALTLTKQATSCSFTFDVAIVASSCGYLFWFLNTH